MVDAPTPTGTVTTPGTPTPAAAAAPAAPAVRPVRQAAKPDRGGFIWGTGRRKTAVARVRVRPGSGKFQVNGREVKEFFREMRDLTDAHMPLEITKMTGKLDVFVNAHGGGVTGQAGAVKLGVSRALLGYDPTLEPILREHNMLTRDPRKVERKKYGQPGARRRFQFSKR